MSLIKKHTSKLINEVQIELLVMFNVKTVCLCKSREVIHTIKYGSLTDSYCKDLLHFYRNYFYFLFNMKNSSALTIPFCF